MKVIEEITNVIYDRLMTHSNEFLQRHRYYKRGGRLFYKMPSLAAYPTSSQKHHRAHWVIVVAPRDREAVMLAFFTNLYTRVGRDSFYTKLREKYGNISRRQAFEFLQKQPEYQLHLIQPRERTLRPNNATEINARWQMDHIDMQKYFDEDDQNVKWIFVVIDTFSKYVWAKACLNKDAESVHGALEEILADNRRITGGQPAVIQSDNAREYKSNLITGYLKTKRIKQLFIPPYMPQANGIVERVNRTIKNAIHTNFTQNDDTMYSDRLELIVKEYNNSYHTTIKDTPARLHKRNRANVAQQKMVKEHIDEWTKTWRNYPELRIGDKVRIHILTDKDERKKKFAKKFIPQWSTEVFEVFRIISPARKLSNTIDKRINLKPKYVVVNIEGEEMEKGFYRHDLQKIDASELNL